MSFIGIKVIEGYVNVVIYNIALDITFGNKKFFLQSWATFERSFFTEKKKILENLLRSPEP